MFSDLCQPCILCDYLLNKVMMLYLRTLVIFVWTKKKNIKVYMDKEGDLSACRDGFLMLTGRVRGKRASLACGVLEASFLDSRSGLKLGLLLKN